MHNTWAYKQINDNINNNFCCFHCCCWFFFFFSEEFFVHLMQYSTLCLEIKGKISGMGSFYLMHEAFSDKKNLSWQTKGDEIGNDWKMYLNLKFLKLNNILRNRTAMKTTNFSNIPQSTICSIMHSRLSHLKASSRHIYTQKMCSTQK